MKKINTICDHYYEERDKHSNLKDVVCNKCSHGMQINKDIKVKKGKIQWNK